MNYQKHYNNLMEKAKRVNVNENIPIGWYKGMSNVAKLSMKKRQNERFA
jgi:hypothetical protein